MAKQDKVVSARRQRERQDDSVLIRSAESLGRVIGTLQRQLDGATRRLKTGAVGAIDTMSAVGSNGDGGGIKRAPGRKAAADASAAPERAAKKAARPRRAGAAGTKTATATTAARGARKASKAATSTKPAKRSETAKTKRQR